VGLLLAEALVRILSPQPLTGTWRVHSAHGYYLNKADGVAQHQLGDRSVRYRFNTLHLRGPEPSPAGLRVLVLGDSFAFGWLLEEPETIVGQLQSFADARFGARAVQFLNGGVGGWGTADYTAFLEDFGDEISPHVVIVLLNTDDIGRSVRRSIYDFRPGSSVELERKAVEPSVLAGMRNVVNDFPAMQWLFEHSHVVQLARAATVKRSTAAPDSMYLAHTPAPAASSERSLSLGRALFSRMDDWCDQRGVRLFVVTTGFQWLYSTVLPDSDLEPTREFLKDAPSFFADQGIPFHDTSVELAQAMRPRPREFVIPNDFHPNEAGSLLVATAVWKWIEPQLGGPNPGP
jgi:lysophospholipase L1-like esterase